MAKKSSYKINFDAPVTLCFIFIALAVFAADYFTKGKIISSFLTCGGTKNSPLPFNYSRTASWVAVFLHFLGNSNLQSLIVNLSFIVLLGPALEERYGSIFLIPMIIVSSIVSGVLNAAISPATLAGSGCVIFTLAILASLNEFTKKNIKISWILIILFYLAWSLITRNKTEFIPVILELMGGLCGSLLAFMTAPKKKTERKSKKASEPTEANVSQPETVSASSDETIIGNITL